MKPLAEELRPKTFDDVVGHKHLLGKNGLIHKIILAKKPVSLLLWGPPGCGKTTIARLYAKAFDSEFVSFSAVYNNVSDLKKLIKEHEKLTLFSRKIILFVDEIHRFNKTQQDAFLPYVEDGTIVLIGATTENPSFSLSGALLSRMKVLMMQSLSDQELLFVIERFEAQNQCQLSSNVKKHLIQISQGDARHLLNLLQLLKATNPKLDICIEDIEQLCEKRLPNYDKHQDGHFNLISALHKSVRGSDPQAALYWLARMLDAGEDPLYLCRRLIRMASEDIGLADPNALNICINASEAYQRLGSPEGELAIAQATVYLSLAPKSNRVYEAYSEAMQLAKNTSEFLPPKHILNAPTKLMKEQGFSKGYIYDHDTKHAFAGQEFFPEKVKKMTFYRPSNRGYEAELRRRVAYFASLKKTP